MGQFFAKILEYLGGIEIPTYTVTDTFYNTWF